MIVQSLPPMGPWWRRPLLWWRYGRHFRPATKAELTECIRGGRFGFLFNERLIVCGFKPPWHRRLWHWLRPRRRKGWRRD